MDIIKNPIVIGLVVGGLTYWYLKNQADKENDKHKKNSKYIKKEVNLVIPLVMTILGWFLAYTLLIENDNTSEVSNLLNTLNITDKKNNIPLPLQVPTSNTGYKFTKDITMSAHSDSSGERALTLLTGGVSIPTKATNLPDVMLDML